MLTSMRKNQKGLAVVEYVIVLAVVAALAYAVFGGTDSMGSELSNRANTAKNQIKNTAPK